MLGTTRTELETLPGIDISISHNLTKVLAREPATADLDTFDRYVRRLKEDVVRPPEDLPFNDAFWSFVRSSFGQAQGHGFRQPDEADTFVVKSFAEVMACRQSQESSVSCFLPIAPQRLVETTGLSRHLVLTELLYATSIGMMEMVWSAECKGCGGAACSKRALNELSNHLTCELCRRDNQVDYLDGVKVIFLFVPEVLYFPVSHFDCPNDDSCPRNKELIFAGIAYPTTNNSGFSYILGGDHSKASPALARGRYRVYCPYAQVDSYIEIKRDATADDIYLHHRLVVSQLVRPKAGQHHKVLQLEHGKVGFDVVCDTGSLLAICIYNDIDDTTLFSFPEHARPKYTTATECLHTPCFRSLFGNQVVNEASRFTIKRVVLVFTDVVSSTALYDEAGDGPALDIVREHFKVIFSAFASKGRIVKTIGDAVMGAFTNGEDAIFAAADALDKLVGRVRRPDGTPLQVRIGIHCGPALVVPLNGINDYFGSTVNVAARVESKASDGECLVSETVLADPATKAAFDKMLAGGYVNTRDIELSLKGVGSTIRASGFRSKEKN